MSSHDSRGSAKVNSQPRTQQACQRCRSLKARCLPSTEHGTCQRCFKSKRECIWPDVQQRPKVSRGPSRISQVEKKLDGLVASIVNVRSTNQTVTPAESPQEANESLIPEINDDSHHHEQRSSSVEKDGSVEPKEVQSDTVQDVVNLHMFEFDLNDPPDESIPSMQPPSRNMRDPLTDTLLTHPHAEKLFELYRPMSHGFPFVPIDANMTAHGLCKRKPILLLAIMAVAAGRDRKLQASLDKQFRTEFANRVFIEPRKNLALLQGVLVYLGWYHTFFDPACSNTTMLQTAIGITIELKLDPRTMPQLLPGRNNSKRVKYGKEGERALLGCYYISSITANCVRAQNLFPQSYHMAERARQLGEQTEQDSDVVLAIMTRAQRLNDQIFDFFYSNRLQDMSLSYQDVLAQLDAWEAYIQAQKAEINSREESHILGFHYFAIEIELYHSMFRQLRKYCPRSYPNALETTKIRMLSSCIEAGKSFLDTLISIPTDEFYLLPFATWYHLPRIMIALAMFTSPSVHHIPEWDIKMAQDRVRLDLFLESLCFRMQNLSTFDAKTQPLPDFWLAQKMVLENVAKWYKKQAKHGSKMLTPASSADTASTWSTWDTGIQESDSQNAELPYGHPILPSSQIYTTPSAANSAYPHPEIPAQLLSNFSQVMCPMVNFRPGSDLDQLMDTGFWTDDLANFNTMDFDLIL